MTARNLSTLKRAVTHQGCTWKARKSRIKVTNPRTGEWLIFRRDLAGPALDEAVKDLQRIGVDIPDALTEDQAAEQPDPATEPVPDAPADPEPEDAASDSTSTGEQEAEEPTMKIHQCGQCRFADPRKQAVSMHAARLKDTPHPQGEYPCPHCPAVRSTADGYQRHLATRHDYSGFMCHTCLIWLPAHAEWVAHLNTEHPDSVPERFRITHRPSPAPESLEPADLLPAITRIFREYRDLKTSQADTREVEELRAQVSELRRERDDLLTRLALVREAMAA
ncbi:hypothetical protein ACFY05_31925 [Microtetraspora fusca]|uniref:C2H2-type domain-containing protein n=1 Tax=Microtetraspora fusca TaxID=1997 RepID=A0ABW6VI88_MICFU